MMRMYREEVINLQRLPDVLKEWEDPSFDEFGERNAWRLFNAATYALTGRVVDRPEATPKLYKIMDGVCEHIQ